MGQHQPAQPNQKFTSSVTRTRLLELVVPVVPKLLVSLEDFPGDSVDPLSAVDLHSAVALPLALAPVEFPPLMVLHKLSCCPYKNFTSLPFLQIQFFTRRTREMISFFTTSEYGHLVVSLLIFLLWCVEPLFVTKLEISISHCCQYFCTFYLAFLECRILHYALKTTLFKPLKSGVLL